MASFNFTYCKLGNLKDINFNLVYLKQNELESYKNVIFDECLKKRDAVLSQFIKSKKEYYLRLKLENEFSELSQQETVASHKLSHLLKKWQNYKEAREIKDKKKELKIVSLYEKNVGLKIEPASNLNVSDDEIAISFLFENVDESRPKEMCSFNLVITDSGLYKAVDCHPSLEELNELILKLNNTNDLHDFIINIRRKFCECLSRQI